MALDKGYNGSDGREFEVAPDGVYVCTLKKIEQKLMPKYGEPEVEEIRWMWVFESADEADTNGNPYEFTHWTGWKYGNDKAKLTTTLDAMIGVRMTEDEWMGFDVEEELVGKKWRVMVTEITTQAGKVVNRVVKVSPMTPPRRQLSMDGTVKVQDVENGKTRVQKPRLQKVAAGGDGRDAQGRTPDDPNYDPYEDD